jgi:hypothetical protein
MKQDEVSSVYVGNVMLVLYNTVDRYLVLHQDYILSRWGLGGSVAANARIQGACRRNWGSQAQWWHNTRDTRVLVLTIL